MSACGCTADSSLPDICPACRHREHGRSGCRVPTTEPTPDTPESEPHEHNYVEDPARKGLFICDPCPDTPESELTGDGLRAARYVEVVGQQPNARRMCRRGCVENPDGTWSLCAWHEDKAQWAARETHVHDPALCPQCAALPNREAAPRGGLDVDLAAMRHVEEMVAVYIGSSRAPDAANDIIAKLRLAGFVISRPSRLGR